MEPNPDAGRPQLVLLDEEIVSMAVQRVLTESHINLLAGEELFARLDRVALARVSTYVELSEVEDQAVVCRQGEPGDSLYIVVRGRFGVFVSPSGEGPELQVASLSSGNLFGEMALLTGEPRSATVRSQGPGEVLRLDGGRFQDLVAREPAVPMAIIASLSRTLRARDSFTQPRTEMCEETSRMEVAAAPVRPVAGISTESQRRAAYAGLAAVIPVPLAAGPRETIHQAALRIASRLQEARTPRSTLLGATAALGCIAAAFLLHSQPRPVFGLLLAAALVLYATEAIPSFAVSLGLLALWVVFGVAKPEQVGLGFASLNWFFILSIVGIAAAVAQSGLLFRAGLLLVRRMPASLAGRAGTLMLTGLLLSPLLPEGQARCALTSPIALAVSEASRLRDREPASAVLGLASWIGSFPLMFTFLNGSSTALLVWGLLPASSRIRGGWFHWLEAAAPLTLFIAVCSFASLFLILRPKNPAAPRKERVDLQLAVLGSLSSAEKSMLGVLILTAVGWLVAPTIGLDVRTIALGGLLLAVVSGCFNKQAFAALDWNFLVFFGVALSIRPIAVSLGLDHLIGQHVDAGLGLLHGNPLLVILFVAGLNLVVRLALEMTQTVLLLGLILIPAAPHLGVDPGIIGLTLLATTTMWFLPTQTGSYLVASMSSEGRLYSHAQARRVCFAYAAITLIGLVVVTPYWHLLGLV